MDSTAFQAPPAIDFPGKNIGVVCHFLLQEIFPTQGSNLGLHLTSRQTLYCLSRAGDLHDLSGEKVPLNFRGASLSTGKFTLAQIDLYLESGRNLVYLEEILS